MNLETKLNLLRKYDFQNFQSKFAAISAINLLFEKKQNPEYVKHLVEFLDCIYEWAQEKYDRIDFKELEKVLDTPQDRNDFTTLFKTRELLTQFKKAVDEFSVYCQEHNYDIPPNPQEFGEVFRLYGEIIDADKYEGVPYRLRKQDLERSLGVELSRSIS